MPEGESKILAPSGGRGLVFLFTHDVVIITSDIESFLKE